VIQRLIADGVVYLSAEPGKESQACGARSTPRCRKEGVHDLSDPR
jgi:hypothetical protein